MHREIKYLVPLLAGIGACARLVPHPWNFTPLMAIALYAGARSEKASNGLVVTLAALLLSDMLIGFYDGMWYVYAAAVLPVAAGRAIRAFEKNRRESPLPIGVAALLSSAAFFIITNGMFWATRSFYPHTMTGLISCLGAAVPFYRNQLTGDACYTLALFAGHYWIVRLAKLEPRNQAA